MSQLATLLREELALNPHNDDEANYRCTCDECISAIQEIGVRVVGVTALRKAFAEVSDAAFFLPLPYLDDARVAVFQAKLHHLHVAITEATK